MTFDAGGPARHNSGVSRLAVAAIVFCATLMAALIQGTPGLSTAWDAAGAATIEPAPHDCASADDDRRWSPRQDEAASITESGWKCRTLHAGLSTGVRPGTIAAFPVADAPSARAPESPSYLLHTPLLI